MPTPTTARPAGSDPRPPTRPGQVWPAGPLDAAQHAFDLLTCPPAALAVDCRGLAPDLPDRIVGLHELKPLLLREATSRSTRDLVWADLVTRARRDGPAWVVAATGIAMPGLRRKARQLTPGWHGDREDLDSELLTGFLERLRVIDLDAANICARLLDAGARAVLRSRRHDQDTSGIHPDTAHSLAPARPWDHPDFVLARAAAAAVIGPEEWLLISATRLEDIPLHAVAEELGVSTATAGAWRRRGERHLAAAIHAGELHWPAAT